MSEVKEIEKGEKLICLNDLKRALRNASKINKKKLEDSETLTSIDYLDKNNILFHKGNVTAILGNEEIYKNVYALNLAYNALQLGKKVIYISTNSTAEKVYKQFIMRNTWEDFEEGIGFTDFYNESTIKEVEMKFKHSYATFKEKLFGNLFVIDTIEKKAITKEYLQKMFDMGRQILGEVDIVVLDDIDSLILQEKEKLITTKEKLYEKVIPILIEHSRNFCSTSKKVNIIMVSSIPNVLYESTFNNNRKQTRIKKNK